MFHPVRWKVRLSELTGVVSVAASLCFVLESKRVVDIATGASDAPFRRHVCLLLSIMVLQIACNVFTKYWQGRNNVHTLNSTRADVFARVMKSVWSGKEKFHSGDTVNRLEDDIQEVSSFLSTNVPETVVTFMQFIAASVYFIVLSPHLAWILLLIMPTAVVASRLFFKKMRALTGEIRAADSLVQGHMQENIQHRVLVKTVGSVGEVLAKLGTLQKDVWTKTLTRLDYASISRAFMSTGFMTGYALVFLWGVCGLKDGTVTYGMMVAFLQLVGQVQRPVSTLANQIPAFIKALSSEERLLELMEQQQEEEGEDVRISLVPGIRMDRVSFSYEGYDKKILSDFSCDFKPGTFTAVIGSTGAGKSTLVKILLSLLPPDSGNVTLYGDGREVASSSMTRCNFMYVPQGNSLMSGTIRDNLLMANPDASDEEITEALHLAAADFVQNLSDGPETLCTEVGGGLSEGQAQRIAVARALLKKGGILILDEATSALDADTEMILLGNIATAFRSKKTIICITHRSGALKYADSVVELA